MAVSIHYLVVIKLNEYDPDPTYELFPTESEAKAYMSTLSHLVDGELHVLREGKNT